MLLTVFQPSEQALQALTAPLPSPPKPAKQPPQTQAPIAVAPPEPQPLKVQHCQLHIIHYLYLLFITYCLQLIVCYLLFITYCLLLIVY